MYLDLNLNFFFKKLFSNFFSYCYSGLKITEDWSSLGCSSNPKTEWQVLVPVDMAKVNLPLGKMSLKIPDPIPDS